MGPRAVLPIVLALAGAARADAPPCTGQVLLPAVTVTRPDAQGGPSIGATWDLPTIPDCAVMQGYRFLDADTLQDLPQLIFPNTAWQPTFFDNPNGTQIALYLYKGDFDPGGQQRSVTVRIGWGPARPPKLGTACVGDIGVLSDGIPKPGYALTRLDCSFCVLPGKFDGTFHTTEGISLPSGVTVTSVGLTDVTSKVEGKPFRYCASDADCRSDEFCYLGPWCANFPHSGAPICTPLVVDPGAAPAATPFADTAWSIDSQGTDGNDPPNYLMGVETHATVPLDQYGPLNCNLFDGTFCPLTWMLSVTYRCPDADGDGLCDDWERYGVTIDPGGGASPQFIDLPAMGADPNKPDVFLQVDWMDCAVDGGDCAADRQHSHKLSSAAIRGVIKAFADSPYRSPTGSTGINLHVDEGPDSPTDAAGGTQWGTLSRAKALAHVNALGTETNGVYSFSAFDAIRNANFARSGRVPIFHYVVSGHNYGSTTSSGVSRSIGASDLMVTLGSFDGDVGTVEQQAGTLMHELGHNLGLKHGGGDGVNHKPNYLSLMNYTFQLRGLRKDGHEGVLDYSRTKLGDLDELDLDETPGLPGATGFGTRHWCVDTGAYVVAEPATGVIDWDCDNDPGGTGVNADVNGDALCVGPGADGVSQTTAAGDDQVVGESIYDGVNHRCDTTAAGDDTQERKAGGAEPAPLAGFDDWSNLKLIVGAVGTGAPGAPVDAPMEADVDPMTIEEAAKVMPFPEPLCAGDGACDDGDPCTNDRCIPADGCLNAAIPGCVAAPATTTTTAPVGPSTTTTTTLVATTTSTTLPAAPCAGLTSFDGVQCVCHGGITPAACATDRVPTAIGKLFSRACTLMGHAAGLGTPKKVKKAVHGADGAFGKALAKAAKAGSAKKHPLSPSCGAALTTTLGDAKQRTDRISDSL